jgi:hypothetical protein
MSLKCNYCKYTAVSLDQLDVHLSKCHERRLAVEGEDKLDNPPLREHPEWPVPRGIDIGFENCSVCAGQGFVYNKAKIGDPTFGKTIYCPQCYPGLGPVPRMTERARH